MAAAEKVPSGPPLENPGFIHFYNLEYDQALTLFRAEAAAEESPDAYNHIAQTIIFRAMFRAGVLDSGMMVSAQTFLHMPKVPLSVSDNEEFKDTLGRAMALAEERLDSCPDDTGALYALGVSHGLLGNYDLVVQKKYTDALREATAARKLHNRATAIDPDFADARLMQGLNDYIVGSLPFAWKILGFLGGFRGDKQRGIQTLELVGERGVMNRIDAKVMLLAIYRREKHPEKSVEMLDDLIPRIPRNYLLRLELAEMYSDMRCGARAMEVLSEIERMKAERAPGYEYIPEQKIERMRARIAAEAAKR